jgi:hypothetical protein
MEISSAEQCIITCLPGHSHRGILGRHIQADRYGCSNFAAAMGGMSQCPYPYQAPSQQKKQKHSTSLHDKEKESTTIVDKRNASLRCVVCFYSAVRKHSRDRPVFRVCIENSKNVCTTSHMFVHILITVSCSISDVLWPIAVVSESH